MAEKTALLFWRVWAVAAVVGTAVPAARLCWPEHSALGVSAARSPSTDPSIIARSASLLTAPEPTEDRLLARLAKAETGPERCSLCEQLPSTEDPSVTYAIAAVLEHAHLGSVRACAAEALTKQPTAEARSWLIELSDDPQPEVHSAALAALAAAADDAALSVVLEATHSDNQEIRLSAVMALLGARRAEGFAAAAAVLPSIEDRDTLLTLVDALGDAHDARALPVFLALLEGGERESHLHAIRALGRLGSALAVPVLEPLLESSSIDEFDAAAEALSVLAPNTVLPLLRRQLETGDGAHQRLALSAILSSKSPEVSALAHEQLRSGDSVRARVVLQHLTRSPDPSFEPDLTQLAEGAPSTLQRAALRVLRRLDSPSARASADRIQGKLDDRTPRRSLQELAGDPSQAAQAELLRSLDDSEAVSGNLASVIQLAPVSTIERVIARAAGLGLENRRALIDGLAQRGEPRFAPALRAALGESDSAMRTSALRGLASLGDLDVGQDVTRLTRASDAGDRSLAVELLSMRTDDGATRDIAALAGDSDMEVVCSALRALDLRSPELVLGLATRAFRAGSSDERQSLLGNLNSLPQSVLRPLNELALAEGDDNVAIAALQTLSTLEGPESAQRLLAVANDGNRSSDVRSAAAQGLRHLGGPLARSNRTLLDTLSPADDPGAYTCEVTR